MKPIVAIVGRPNVGKSTLFNRLVGRRLAIVEDFPGVTRDRLAAEAEWNGRTFTLVDTGGIEFRERGEILRDASIEQTKLAIREADVIIWVVDGKEGATAEDNDLAGFLRKSGRPVLMAVNKMESPKQQIAEYDFYGLGFDEPIPISAEHGRNTGDLLDRVLASLPPEPEEDANGAENEAGEGIRVAIVGRPNVGKSSLLNRLAGGNRVIVSNVPGTTRDAIDVTCELNGRRFLFVDTAGMRRKAKVDEPVEYYSVLRTLRAMDRSRVVLILIDANDKVTEQDKKIAGYAHNKGKASILVVNKWDEIEKDGKTAMEFEEEIREELAFMNYAPVIFLSALSGQRVSRLPELIEMVDANHARRLGTSELNGLINDAVAQSTNRPPTVAHSLKIYYTTQVNDRPPAFLLFCNEPERVHYSYERYLENKLRAARDFTGTPLRLIWKRRSREEK